MKRLCTVLLICILGASASNAQTFNLGIVGDPLFGCTAACNPSVCSPTATGGQPVYETVNSNDYLIPANSNVRVQISTVLCAAANLGPGLDLGDTVFINGQSVIAPTTANNVISYDECFSTATPYTLTISLKANRRDETIRVVLTISAGAGAGCSILPPPVPVRLIDFAGRLNSNQTVTLNWKTASEQNSRTTIIEQSQDGANFKPLGSIAMAGNSAISKTYQFTDATILAGRRYYRLKIVDADGTYAYSKIIFLVGSKASTSITVYPNPAVDQINITSNKPMQQVTLVDMKGQVLLQQTTGLLNTWRLAIGQLPAGKYIVRVQTAKEVSSISFLK